MRIICELVYLAVFIPFRYLIQPISFSSRFALSRPFSLINLIRPLSTLIPNIQVILPSRKSPVDAYIRVKIYRRQAFCSSRQSDHTHESKVFPHGNSVLPSMPRNMARLFLIKLMPHRRAFSYIFRFTTLGPARTQMPTLPSFLKWEKCLDGLCSVTCLIINISLCWGLWFTWLKHAKLAQLGYGPVFACMSNMTTVFVWAIWRCLYELVSTKAVSNYVKNVSWLVWQLSVQLVCIILKLLEHVWTVNQAWMNQAWMCARGSWCLKQLRW